jgi:hypothetical protein
MKKIFLNESEKRKLISEKEKMIIESFAKTFNKIKRIDENEISTQPNYRNNSWNKQILKVGDKITVSNLPDVAPRGYENVKIGDTLSITNVRRNTNGIVYDTDFSVDYGISNDDIQTLTNKFKHIGENEMGNTSESNPENARLKFDRIFNEILSMEPKYSYIETQSSRLSGRYNSRSVSDGKTTAVLYNNELEIELIITYNNSWEEDPDGASYFGYLSMSYEHWDDFGDNELDEMLTRFDDKELIQNPGTGEAGITIEKVKGRNMINDEFMSLLSDETKQKLYGQIEGLLIEHSENQNNDDDDGYY